jgi:hypothetical protein
VPKSNTQSRAQPLAPIVQAIAAVGAAQQLMGIELFFVTAHQPSPVLTASTHVETLTKVMRLHALAGVASVRKWLVLMPERPKARHSFSAASLS